MFGSKVKTDENGRSIEVRTVADKKIRDGQKRSNERNIGEGKPVTQYTVRRSHVKPSKFVEKFKFPGIQKTYSLVQRNGSIYNPQFPNVDACTDNEI